MQGVSIAEDIYNANVDLVVFVIVIKQDWKRWTGR